MYGVTAEQAGDGSPDIVRLLREEKGEAPVRALPVELVLATHWPTDAAAVERALSPS